MSNGGSQQQKQQQQQKGGGGPTPYISFPDDDIIAKTGEGMFRIRTLVGLSGKNSEHDIMLRLFFQDKLLFKTLKLKGGEAEYIFENVKPDLTRQVLLKVQVAGTNKEDTVILPPDMFLGTGATISTRSETESSFTATVGLVRPDGFNPVQLATRDGNQGNFLFRLDQKLHFRKGPQAKEFPKGGFLREATDNNGLLTIDIRPVDWEGDIYVTHQETGHQEPLFLGKN